MVTEGSEGAGAPDREEPALAAALFAELLGTFALALIAAGSEVVAVFMAMIYALGDVSGAHFNPAVTLAFALRGDFPWIRVPGYWFVQLLGAVLASALLRLLFGMVADIGDRVPISGWPRP
jgi:aquaporin Z